MAAYAIRLTYILLVLGCLVRPGTTVAQDTADWHGYFPLAVGNVWQYHVEIYDDKLGIPVAVWQIEWLVASEADLSGQSYFLVEGRCDVVWSYDARQAELCETTRVDSVFVRYDATLANVVRFNPPPDEPCRAFFFGRDFRLDIEEASTGESALGCAESYAYSTPETEAVTIGGETRETLVKYVGAQDAFLSTRTFAHGIGLTNVLTCSNECVARTLTYTNVAGDEVGTPIAIPRTRLTVESSSPESFEFEVVVSTVEVGFSEPLDWTTPEHTVVLLLAPESSATGAPSPGASPNLARFDAQHAASTDHTWIVSTARAESGIQLDFPHVLRYTSAGSWGEYSVSGKIPLTELRPDGFGWIDPRRIVVALLREEPDETTFTNFLTAAVAAAAGVAHDYTFVITRVRPGTYWPVAVLDANGDGRIDAHLAYPKQTITVQSGDIVDIDFGDEGTDVAVDESPRPSSFTLSAPYPNPASGEVTLQFRLDEPTVARIEMYDALGRRVATVLEPAFRAAGDYVVTYAVDGLSSGWYFARLTTDGAVEHRGVVVAR